MIYVMKLIIKLPNLKVQKLYCRQFPELRISNFVDASRKESRTNLLVCTLKVASEGHAQVSSQEGILRFVLACLKEISLIKVIEI